MVLTVWTKQQILATPHAQRILRKKRLFLASKRKRKRRGPITPEDLFGRPMLS